MKETTPFAPDQTEVHAQKAIEKKTVLVGKLRPQPGQKVYECDLTNGQITESEITETVKLVNGRFVCKKDIKVKPGFLYCVAINKKNADKQFVKRLEKLL